MSMLPSLSPKPLEWDLYAQQLGTRGHGYPLWGPEPSLESGEVRLGDVGYLRKGYFCFLFNCMRSACDEVNSDRGVPQGFEVFQPPDGRGPHSGTRRENVVMPPHLLSGSIESWAVQGSVSVGPSTAIGVGAGAGYQCKEQTGALLMLKTPGHETYLECETSIMYYMKKHLNSWHEYAKARGLRINAHELLFVSGFVKTSVWGVGAFRHRSSSGLLHINGGAFTPGIAGSGQFGISMSACKHPEVFHRYGPLDRIGLTGDLEPQHESDSELQQMSKNDQCIFLNYIHMKPRRLLRLRAAAGPHGLDCDRDSPSELSAAVNDYSFELADDQLSADSVLDYMLENSDAQIACASAKQMFSLFDSKDMSQDPAEALRALRPRIVVDEKTGIGTICEFPASTLKDSNLSHQRGKMAISTSSEQWETGDSMRGGNKDCKVKEARTVAREDLKPQPQRDMFAKLPRRSYVNVDRTQVGLLSQLLNPDPSIFAPGHPYRASRSMQDMTQWERQGGGWTLQISKSSPAVPFAAQITALAPVVLPSTKWQGLPRQSGVATRGAKDARTQEAAEAQRQRDMFAKVPKRSYSNLNRTRSGLLSQLLNPDPSIFPPNHPYRATRSTQDMTQWARQGGEPMLQMSKSSAAVPLAAQVTARAPVAHPSTQTQSHNPGPLENGGGNGGNGSGYTPKGRPQAEELEDTESDDESPDDSIYVSRNLVQQKLAPIANPDRQRYADRSSLPISSRQAQKAGVGEGRMATTPIALRHPYNLPAPQPPMSPRTTRQQMLQTELSESLRRNLMWERQVSGANMNVHDRKSGELGGGRRPFMAMEGSEDEPASSQDHQQPSPLPHHQQEGDDKEELRRRAMARNRGSDFRSAGW